MIAIVGGGPVGLTTACLLESYGIQTTVIEASRTRSTQAKAIVLWHGALTTLEQLGLGQELHKASSVLVEASYFSGTKLVGKFHLDGLAEHGLRGPISLPQPDLETLLERRYEQLGGTIARGDRVARIAAVGDTVIVTCAGGEELVADYVVGADGVNSIIRRAAGIAVAGHTYREHFFLADGYGVPVLQGAEYHMNPDVSAVRVALPGQRQRLFLKMSPDAARLLGADCVNRSLDPEEAAALIARSEYRRFELSTIEFASIFSVRKALASSFTGFGGGVHLAGDAAHVHSPAGGQGLNLGIQDARSLAWRLAVMLNDDDPAPLLEYSRQRRRNARNVIRTTDLQIRLWGARGVLPIAVRNQLLGRVAVHIDKLLPRLAQLDESTTGAAPGVTRILGPAAVRDAHDYIAARERPWRPVALHKGLDHRLGRRMRDRKISSMVLNPDLTASNIERN